MRRGCAVRVCGAGVRCGCAVRCVWVCGWEEVWHAHFWKSSSARVVAKACDSAALVPMNSKHSGSEMSAAPASEARLTSRSTTAKLSSALLVAHIWAIAIFTIVPVGAGERCP